jgi:hypothetical protein
VIDQLLTKEKFNHDIGQAAKERTRLIQSYDRLRTRLAPSNTTFGVLILLPVEYSYDCGITYSRVVFLPGCYG